MSSIRKNIGYQTVYQILNVIIPLVTAPYISRVLGASSIGLLSYSSSIVNYFVIFARLGLTNYGTRSIAACGESKDKRNRVFCEIYSMQIITAVAAILFYVIFLLFFCHDNRVIFVVQGILVVDCIINVSWLFFGLEKFRTTVIRSIFFRVVSFLLMFILVKKPEDAWIYAFLLTFSTFGSNFVLFVLVPKQIKIVHVDLKDVISHFKPNVMLFLPLLAMSIYHLMDKTMLGYFGTYEQSGFYSNVDKIVNIPVELIAGISTVLLPRMSMLIGQKEYGKANALFKQSLEFTVCAGSALAFGIAAVAKEFEPLFFGPGYDACVMLTVVLSPVLIIKSFSITARYQYLVPYHKENDYTLSVVIGALVNLVVNFLLIPVLGAMGAVIGTLLAELAACLSQYYSLRKYIELRKTLLSCFGYIAIGAVMAGIVRITALMNIQSIVKIGIEIIIGVLSFGICCLIYWKATDNTQMIAIMQEMPVIGKVMGIKRGKM